MIKRIELRNFTVFTDLALDLSPKINVIIGENGTGKTHLLKVAYGLCTGVHQFRNKVDISGDEIEAALTTKLLRLFMPMDDKLGKLHRQGASGQAYLSTRSVEDPMITATFFNNSKTLDIQERTSKEQFRSSAIFIPTKEVFSFMKGFNSLYEKYGLSFDQTYQDICLLLDLPEIRQDSLHEKSKWAMAELEGICGGRFVFPVGERSPLGQKMPNIPPTPLPRVFGRRGCSHAFWKPARSSQVSADHYSGMSPKPTSIPS